MTGAHGASELRAFARELVGFMDDVAQKRMLAAAGDDIRQDVEAGFAADLGGDKALGNWPRRSKRLGALEARWSIDGTSLAVTPKSMSVGPLSMLESGRTPRSAGQYRPRGSRTGKGGAYTRLAAVNRTVGPMAAKGTWTDGVDNADPLVVQRLDRHLDAEVNRLGKG